MASAPAARRPNSRRSSSCGAPAQSSLTNGRAAVPRCRPMNRAPDERAARSRLPGHADAQPPAAAWAMSSATRCIAGDCDTSGSTLSSGSSAGADDERMRVARVGQQRRRIARVERPGQHVDRARVHRLGRQERIRGIEQSRDGLLRLLRLEGPDAPPAADAPLPGRPGTTQTVARRGTKRFGDAARIVTSTRSPSAVRHGRLPTCPFRQIQHGLQHGLASAVLTAGRHRGLESSGASRHAPAPAGSISTRSMLPSRR